MGLIWGKFFSQNLKVLAGTPMMAAASPILMYFFVVFSMLMLQR
jgi:hypothetical protein